jgi:hypothetical protein
MQWWKVLISMLISVGAWQSALAQAHTNQMVESYIGRTHSLIECQRLAYTHSCDLARWPSMVNGRYYPDLCTCMKKLTHSVPQMGTTYPAPIKQPYLANPSPISGAASKPRL